MSQVSLQWVVSMLSEWPQFYTKRRKTDSHINEVFHRQSNAWSMVVMYWWQLAKCLITNSNGIDVRLYMNEECCWCDRRIEVGKYDEVDEVSDSSLCCCCIARNERRIRCGMHTRWWHVPMCSLRTGVHISTAASETWLYRDMYCRCWEKGSCIVLLRSMQAWIYTSGRISEAPSDACQ